MFFMVPMGSCDGHSKAPILDTLEPIHWQSSRPVRRRKYGAEASTEPEGGLELFAGGRVPEDAGGPSTEGTAHLCSAAGASSGCRHLPPSECANGLTCCHERVVRSEVPLSFTGAARGLRSRCFWRGRN